MEMTFNYYYTEQPNGSLGIENIGDVVINALNDDAQEWYMDVSTKYGWTTVKTFGPLKVDFNTLENYFSFNYSRFEYNEQKLIKLIEKFINDNKRMITQVTEIDHETFEVRLREIHEGTDN